MRTQTITSHAISVLPSRARVGPADLDLVIPALNEEHRIGETLFRTCRELEQAPFTARLIIVDNGCVVATAEAVDAALEAHVPVEVIGCARRGKGAAVRAGVLYSSAPYVAYCDADLSTPPSALLRAYQLLSAGGQVVIASRKLADASYAVPQPWVRRVGSRTFEVFASGMTTGVRDTQCGFKAFRADVALEAFSKLSSSGFAFDVELLARIQRGGHTITEMPIVWEDSPGSSFRPVSDGVRAFRELLAVRQALRMVS